MDLRSRYEAAVRSVHPHCGCKTVYSLCMNAFQFVIVEDSRKFSGRWITGKHRTSFAAWKKAASLTNKIRRKD
jgi:hypothetical protein